MVCTLNDIYTNSTTNYKNIDTQKSVHFAVSRTETRLKMHQTCIYEILVICRALQALYTPQRCELMKTKKQQKKKKKKKKTTKKKTNKKKKKKKKKKQTKNKTNKNTNCSYRIFIVCRSPVSPVFWARILLTYLFLPKQSLCTNFAIMR